MARGIIYVETMPASPDREAEYHKWYNDTHLEQILSVDGHHLGAPVRADERQWPVHRDLRTRLRRPRCRPPSRWADWR